MQIHEARAAAVVLKLCADEPTVDALTGKQVVQVGLRLGALSSGIVTPPPDERPQGGLNLLAATHP
jgi:hypothetical protein